MYHTRSQIAFVIPYRKTNTGQEAVFFLGLKISHSIKNMKITIVYDDAFLHTYSEEKIEAGYVEFKIIFKQTFQTIQFVHLVCNAYVT